MVRACLASPCLPRLARCVAVAVAVASPCSYDLWGNLTEATITGARAAVDELRAARAAAAAATAPEYADEEEEAAAMEYEAFLLELEPDEPEPGGEEQEDEFYEAGDE